MGAADRGALEAQIDGLSQRHFLAGTAQWQSANLLPLLLIGLCSLYLPEWELTAALIVLNMLCGAALFAVSKRLHRAENPPSERRIWRHYNILTFIAGASWAGLMWPAAPTLGTNIASTFVCVLIIATVAVTSLVIATQRASVVHFLAGLILCLLPQTIIHFAVIGPIPLVATLALAPAMWVLADAAYRQDRSLIRTQLEKEQLAQELARALERAEYLANRDSLTGLYNRRAFEKLAHDFRAADDAVPLCLVLIDLDHFKAINDCHGHATGDAVLQRSAQVILEGVRPTDILGRGDGAVARWGGEEFLLLLPNCPLPLAMQIAERLRSRIAALADPAWPADLAVSGSFGVACWGPEAALHQCISDADQAMYRAKQAGRNRVELWAGSESLAQPPSRIASTG